MGIGVSILLIALGSVLYWGVTGDVQGVDLDVVGVVLVIVGAIGLLWTLLATRAFAGRRDTVVEDGEHLVRRS